MVKNAKSQSVFSWLFSIVVWFFSVQMILALLHNFFTMVMLFSFCLKRQNRRASCHNFRHCTGMSFYSRFCPQSWQWVQSSNKDAAKGGFFQKVRFLFQISQSSEKIIPKDYPELEIWIPKLFTDIEQEFQISSSG